jgi:hypothetical protein
VRGGAPMIGAPRATSGGPSAPPRVGIGVGVTGHRAGHPGFDANRARITAVLDGLFAAIDSAVTSAVQAVAPGRRAPSRLHTLVALGTDAAAVELALARHWQVIAPLPFGLDLNVAVNAMPHTVAEARALLAGGDGESADVADRARELRTLLARVQRFELADADQEIGEHLLRMLGAPDDVGGARAYGLAIAERAATAAHVMIEQSDLLIGVWDGRWTADLGGTGQTIAAALERGAPVIWIDIDAPEQWRVLRAPESLAARGSAAPSGAERDADLAAIVDEALRPASAHAAAHETHGRASRGGGSHTAGRRRFHDDSDPLQRERWRPRSQRVFHAYRRIETVFGKTDHRSRFRSLRQEYVAPDAHAAAELDGLRAAVPDDPAFAERIALDVLRRFAWADGVAARLSDAYRSGMVTNFLLSALAIVAGIAYLPLAADDHKWAFALVEFLLLATILGVISVGRRRRWHRRWFETRRIAEYFRHAPILLLLGVARAPGRWPRGVETSWPEWYARHALRELGLPRMRVTNASLRDTLVRLLLPHVQRQRDYHVGKARRLTAAHHSLDRLSAVLFVLAVVSVATYLLLKAGGGLSWWSTMLAQNSSKAFTFLGVLLPTLGGAFAGIRYFGDFERFAAISAVTAVKLDAIESRIQLLLTAPVEELRFVRVADLAHAVDDVVVAEIENWQAVFGGKQITVPV